MATPSKTNWDERGRGTTTDSTSATTIAPATQWQRLQRDDVEHILPQIVPHQERAEERDSRDRTNAAVAIALVTGSPIHAEIAPPSKGATAKKESMSQIRSVDGTRARSSRRWHPPDAPSERVGWFPSQTCFDEGQRRHQPDGALKRSTRAARAADAASAASS